MTASNWDTRRPHAPESPASARALSGVADIESAPLPPIERFLLGEMSGFELPRPLFDVFLLGRLSVQRELEDAQADADRLYAEVCARPAPPIKHLLQPTFADLSRIRGEHAIAQRADAAARRRRGDAA